jgi:hypothetical protein
MKNQILKEKISFFDEFLNSIGTKEKNCICINENHYKKINYNGNLQEFLERLKPFYYFSKLHYIENVTQYNQFITVLRQISKMNDIYFTYKIKYTNSKHYIEYYFFISTPLDEENKTSLEP